MRSVWLIIQREVLVRVRRRTFLLATILAPVLFALMLMLPAILMRIDSGLHAHVALVDETGVLREHLADTKRTSYVVHPDTLQASPLALLRDSLYDGVLIVGADAIAHPEAITYYALKPATVELVNGFSEALARGIEQERLAQSGIPHLDSIMHSIQAKVSVRTVVLDEAGAARESNSRAANVLSIILGGLCYTLMLVSGNMVMYGVIEEKSNRIVEVLVSSVRTFELMMGKILGIVAVFLLQFALWGLLTLVLLAVSVPLLGLFSANEVTALANGTQGMLGGVAPSPDMGALLTPMAGIDFGVLIVTFLFFFLFGYLFYGAMFAAVGSAVDDSADAGQMVTPITTPLMLGFFAVFMVTRAPGGAVAFWFSMIPLFSPVVMPARMVFGVPTWELLLSAGILVISFFAMTWLASRVYRRGILMFGKRHSWREMYGWLRTKS